MKFFDSGFTLDGHVKSLVPSRNYRLRNIKTVFRKSAFQSALNNLKKIKLQTSKKALHYSGKVMENDDTLKDKVVYDVPAIIVQRQRYTNRFLAWI